MAEMEKKHFANKQIERHHERAFGGKETPAEEHAEGSHESFHAFKHAGGVHTVHHHAGGVEHADHATHEEAMEHGKMAMGGGGAEKPPMAEPMEGEEEQWA